MFNFLDETGGDRRNAVRNQGYSVWGIPVKKHTLLVRDESNCSCQQMVYKGTTNSDTLYDCHNILLPNLQPFNSINSHSIVVMDNCDSLCC